MVRIVQFLPFSMEGRTGYVRSGIPAEKAVFMLALTCPQKEPILFHLPQARLGELSGEEGGVHISTITTSSLEAEPELKPHFRWNAVG